MRLKPIATHSQMLPPTPTQGPLAVRLGHQNPAGGRPGGRKDKTDLSGHIVSQVALAAIQPEGLRFVSGLCNDLCDFGQVTSSV